MYVYVTVAELTGPEKQVSLGPVEDDVMLETLLERTMERIDKHLPEKDRANSRHFWYEDRFAPFQRAYLRDLASTVNVSLELRPDYYQVELPNQPMERYAISPELTAAEAIDSLMGFKGAWRCYDLIPRGRSPLHEENSLFKQDTLPFHARLSQQESELIARRKPQVMRWSALLLILCVGIGLLLSFLFARY